MLVSLQHPYVSRYGAPILDRVDSTILTARYFMRCMACTFCYDQCCFFGADVDTRNVARILARAAEIEKYAARPRAQWFEPNVRRDAQFPGGAYTRTMVEHGKCVFLGRGKRGCGIHAYCLDAGTDYHALKPMDCCLFPLTFDEGALRASEEVHDAGLICLSQGATLYEGARAELEFYFGAELIGELGALAASFS